MGYSRHNAVRYYFIYWQLFEANKQMITSCFEGNLKTDQVGKFAFT